jgi:hypothetical protein
MPAKIIDGAAIAASAKEQVKQRVAQLMRSGKAVHLAAVLVGSTPAGELYAQRQNEACKAVGIGYELITLAADAPAERVAGVIEKRGHSGTLWLSPCHKHNYIEMPANSSPPHVARSQPSQLSTYASPS